MTAQLSPDPKFKGWLNNGTPNAFGQLFTYAAGTTTPQATYVDYTQTTPNTNPIILDARGECNLWLDPTLSYKVTQTDSVGNVIWTVDQINGALSPAGDLIPAVDNVYTLGSPSIAWANLYLGAAHIPVLQNLNPGNVLNYAGVDRSGATDSTIGINNALAANKLVYLPSGTYIISSALIAKTGQTIYGDGPATIIQTSDPSITLMSATSCTNTTIRDLKFNVTGSAGASTVAGIHLINSTACKVLRIEMTGMNWSGVWIDNSNECVVRENYFHNFTGTQQDAADITIYCTQSPTAGAAYNLIEDNQCFGGCEHGIAIEDPYYATSAAGFPTRNLVANNRIGQHTGYGILVYMPGNGPTSVDTYNQLIGNHIQDIQGSYSTNRSSGAGIYVAGTAIGTTQIIANQIYNCCVQTLDHTLTPGGIGVNGNTSGTGHPVVLQGNIITGMPQGDGISLSNVVGGVDIIGGAINLPSTNIGTGVGGGALTGHGIYINGNSAVTATGVDCRVDGAGSALFNYANGINNPTATISGGSYLTSGAGICIRADQSGGFNVLNFTLSGVRVRSTSAGVSALSLIAVVAADVVGCLVSSASGLALYVSGSTQVRVSGGNYSSTGATAIQTNGTCTGGFMDKTTYWGGVGNINNGASGFIIEGLTNAAPGTGTWAVGDIMIQSVPVVGQPKGWRCTVAGTSGTWISQGNL